MTTFFVIIVLGHWLAGVDPGTAELALEVRRLVKDLAAPSLATRQAAEEELLRLGPQILRYLPPPETAGSPEAELRLLRIKTQLEMQLAEAFVGSSTVSVPAGVTLRQAVELLVMQSGNTVVWAESAEALPGAHGTLELPIEHVPFWHALELIARRAQCRILPAEGDRALLLHSDARSAEATRSAVAFSGPFRCEILQCTVVGLDREQELPPEIHLRLQLVWEPRLNPIVLYWMGESFRGEDDRGNVLRAAPGEGTREIPPPETACSVSLTQRLSAAAGVQTTRLRRVSGQGVAIVPALPTAFTFSPTKRLPQVRKAAEVLVSLEHVEISESECAVRLRAVYDRAYTAFESHRGWFFTHRPVLRLANGLELQPSTAEPLLQRPNEVAVVFRFRKRPGDIPEELLWVVPAAIVRTTFSFTWEDVPIRVPNGSGSRER